jgi:peroxiredoxin (alkyl hydroperoxide reductase subunit C)
MFQSVTGQGGGVKIRIGDEIPQFTADTTDGPVTLPDDAAGQWFVLFSHPADFTPVCTTEFVGFQNRWGEFAERNTRLVGLSVDGVDSHRAWIEWISRNLDTDVEFPIIDDEDRAVSLLLGMLHPDDVDTQTARSVMIVDPAGVVRTILEYPREVGRNIAEIVRIVGALQLHDETEMLTPENWPNNALLGDKVLVPVGKEMPAPAEPDQYVEMLADWFHPTDL